MYQQCFKLQPGGSACGHWQHCTCTEKCCSCTANGGRLPMCTCACHWVVAAELQELQHTYILTLRTTFVHVCLEHEFLSHFAVRRCVDWHWHEADSLTCATD